MMFCTGRDQSLVCMPGFCVAELFEVFRSEFVMIPSRFDIPVNLSHCELICADNAFEITS